MNLKTYQALSMAEALADVKRDLGRDAVILHTRSFRKGGFLGLGGRSMWEITAAPNMNVPSRNAGKYVSERSAYPQAEKNPLECATPDSQDLDVLEMSEPLDRRQPAQAGRQNFLSQQMSELRRMVESLVARQGNSGKSDLPPELASLHEMLLAQDVAPEIADSLVDRLRKDLTGEQLADEELLRNRLQEEMAAMIPVAGEPPAVSGKGRVIALIGPTGVGKTTTIAKMAANFKIRERKNVGLITIDTYRIAAVDQLRTYADIIEVPLQTVLTAGELHNTVQSMRNLDIVLIDTAGRSQNDRLRLNQLRSFLSAADADEVHLVVSSTANRHCITSTLERFVPVGANRIIMTKLDEAATFGSILNVSSAARVPLSYITTGQDVPEDITPADPARLSGWVLAGGVGEGSYAS